MNNSIYTGFALEAVVIYEFVCSIFLLLDDAYEIVLLSYTCNGSNVSNPIKFRFNSITISFSVRDAH